MEPVLRMASRSAAWTGPMTICPSTVTRNSRSGLTRRLRVVIGRCFGTTCRYIARAISLQAGGQMVRRAILCMALLCWTGTAFGGTVVDATGRSVEVPDHVARVLPAGPPAAILLAAL